MNNNTWFAFKLKLQENFNLFFLKHAIASISLWFLLVLSEHFLTISDEFAYVVGIAKKLLFIAAPFLFLFARLLPLFGTSGDDTASLDLSEDLKNPLQENDVK